MPGLGLSASAYYGRKRRPPSARFRRDAELLVHIQQIHAANHSIYGAQRVHQQLRHQGLPMARCTIERLMRGHGIEGVLRGRKRKHHHRQITAASRPAGSGQPALHRRTGPMHLWLADITYVDTWEGWVYVAFVTDAFSRQIVGWQLAAHLRTDLPLDALEMAVREQRKSRPLARLIHHSDRGCQYTAIPLRHPPGRPPASPHPSAPSPTPTTMRWPKLSTEPSKPNSSTASPGGPAPRSNTP